ncbi:MAG: NAD(P)-dependent oxidoreductase [Bacteroidota bacterium]
MSSSPTSVFLDSATVGSEQILSPLAELGELTTYDYTRADQTVARLTGAQIAITNKVAIGKRELSQLPDLRLICVAATGTNNIDREAAQGRGIPVRNVAGYSTNAVAQLTLTTLFALSYDLIHLNEAVYNGTYRDSPSFAYWRNDFYELSGARFGIIGMGSIGKRVAELATAYGAEVVYYSSSGQDRQPDYPRLSLEELLDTSEVVSIHAPLNNATQNLIAATELQKMRNSAYLLNFGRGGIVNEADLAQAIDEGWIAGAAVDVYEQEPIVHDHPYLSVKQKHRLLLTPHVGWASVEARMKLVAGIAENIKAGY